MQETRVRSLGREDPLEKEMATHSSILAWRISWRRLVGYSPQGHKESDTTEWLHFTSEFSDPFLSIHTHIYIHKYIQIYMPWYTDVYAHAKWDMYICMHPFMCICVQVPKYSVTFKIHFPWLRQEIGMFTVKLQCLWFSPFHQSYYGHPFRLSGPFSTCNCVCVESLTTCGESNNSVHCRCFSQCLLNPGIVGRKWTQWSTGTWAAHMFVYSTSLISCIILASWSWLSVYSMPWALLCLCREFWWLSAWRKKWKC